ncbi:MAG: TonB-dependent receptor plug domain-containing protein [Paludibacteraceae bacterium]|nr:TonB-dependent receptor plug domain-containing protein [Paludibacteraceae bacterium]
MRHRISILMLVLACVLCMHAREDNSRANVPFNGLIVDLLGQPIRRVKVYSFDSNYNTSTDRKGQFGLTNVQPNDTLHLVFQHQTYDIPVEGRKSMRIVLGDQYVLQTEESDELENLGYGYVSRRESYSSLKGVSGELIRRMGYVRILDALPGLLPGIVVTTSATGERTVALRGNSSLMCDITPLFIVDGIVVNTLDIVNIQEVESVEIMRDAFIYGVRGANGAILVTTRRGNAK